MENELNKGEQLEQTTKTALDTNIKLPKKRTQCQLFLAPDAEKTTSTHERKRVKLIRYDDKQGFPLKKIISGGQTGVDMGGLLAGKALGLETGGFIPRGFKTSKGNKPELGTVYGLKDTRPNGERYPLKQNLASMYVDRSKYNVDESDGTLIVREHPGIGTDRTAVYCLTGEWVKNTNYLSSILKEGEGGDLSLPSRLVHKPIFLIGDLSGDPSEKRKRDITNWILRNNIKVLNVSGHREGKYEHIVRDFLVDALKENLSSTTVVSLEEKIE